MLKRACLSMLCCLLLAWGYCLAEKKQIKLKNGETIIGEVVEQTPEGIKVKRPLATVFYPRDQILSIEPVYDVKEDYADRLSKLKKDDFEGQLALGQWALENKLYPEAVKHLEEAVKLKNEERARLLLRQAKAKIEDAQKSKGPSSGAGGDTGTSAGDDGAVSIATQMVSDADIQKIRMAELSDDDQVKVELRKNVVERFLEQVRGRGGFEKKGADAEFRRLPPVKRAKYIIDHTNPDDPFRDDIIIKSDPASMREFRSGVWRWVSTSCAAATCHGSAKGQGGLKLWNVVGRSDNVDYTNFLILDSFHTKDGLQVIRRDEPEESLLLQFGLPDNQAKHRHPKEKPPPFASRTSPLYKATLDWILSLKRPLHPEYGLKSLPPHVMKPIDPLFGLPGSSGPGTKDKDKGGKDKADKSDKPSKPPF
jgi:hypothetical protein